MASADPEKPPPSSPYGGSNPPVAHFTWSDRDGDGSGTVIDFDASGSSDDNGIVSYEWDLDNDGEYDDATGVTTSYDFGDTDPHVVGLRVMDSELQTDTVSDTVKASVFVDLSPVAHFTWSDRDGDGSGTVIDFDASGSSDDNGIVSYEWDLDNDGEYDDATGVTTSYDFGDTDPHVVGLRVTDSELQNDTASDVVQAIEYKGGDYGMSIYPPVADFTWSDNDGDSTGTVIDFDASGSSGGYLYSDIDGVLLIYDIVSYEWDLDNDGEYDDATGVTTSYDFGDTDPHVVGLRVTDSELQVDIVSGTIQASVYTNNPPDDPPSGDGDGDTDPPDDGGEDNGDSDNEEDDASEGNNENLPENYLHESSKEYSTQIEVDFLELEIEEQKYYLYDINQDGDYDLCYNPEEYEVSCLEKTEDGEYLIDFQGDGKWDYTYNSADGKVKKFGEEEKEDFSNLISLMFVFTAIFTIVILCYWIYKDQKKMPNEWQR